MEWIIGLAVLVAIYFFFAFIPSVCSFFLTFRRKTVKPLEKLVLAGTAYEPYKERMYACAKNLQSLPYREISIRTKDRVELKGSYYDRGSDTTILLAHGYRSSALTNFAPQADHLLASGYNVLMIDQRAHGRSGGKYTMLGLKEQQDILDWCRVLLEQPGIRNLFIYGISMGCAAVAYASNRIRDPRIRGMILDCGFASPWEQMEGNCRRLHMPAVILLPIVRICARTVLGIDIRQSVQAALGKTTVPALFMHGTKDDNVPITQGRMNFDACASEKRWLQVEGAGHAVSYFAGGEKTETALDSFINLYSHHENIT